MVHARASFALLATSVLALVAWACGSFSDSSDPPPDDGGTTSDGQGSGDATTEDGPAPTDGGDGGDAGVPVMGTLAPRCPRPGGPTAAPSIAEERELYVAPDGGIEQPFGLAVDSAWVYWATLSDGGAGDAPYDGRGTAKIMRVDRTGAAKGSKPSVIAEGQRHTLALAMAGDYLYWVAMEGSKAVLRRTRRDCASSCAIEPVVDLGSAQVLDLVELGDKGLLAVDGAETAWIVDLASKPPEVKGPTALADFPAVTATPTAGFASAAFGKEIKTVPVATLVPASFATVSTPDGSALQGMSPLTNDCKDLYGWRSANEIWKIGIGGGLATHFTNVSIGGVFYMVPDQSFLYLAAPDGPGVVAVSLSSGNQQTVKAGNVHRLAVDDKGVYWGDHDRNSGGGIWMMVK